MDWESVWKIVLAAISSVGGAGVIIVAISKWVSNIVADNIIKKTEFKFSKELEDFKSDLEKKNYVSKVRFDAEFEIYRQLYDSFFALIRDVYFVAPEFASVPAGEEERKKYENDVYDRAKNSLIASHDVLFKNAPFIQESLYDKFSEIYKLCKMQTNAFERRWNVGILARQEEKERMPDRAFLRTGEIKEKQTQLIKDIRDYLQSLEVIK